MNATSTENHCQSGSLSYREAGARLRLVLQRATSERLNGTQWRTLCAVIALTLSYSKGYDRTFVAKVADLADLDRTDPRKTETKRALRHLSRRGLIYYDPSRANGQASLIGIPDISPTSDGGLN